MVSAATISIVLLIASDFTSNPVGFLASLFSFGVLVAFTAAQLAVIKLRFSKPDLERPFRVPLSIRFRGADVPLPTVVGALATTAIFVAAMATHIGARYAGPIWLAVRSRRLSPRPSRPRDRACSSTSSPSRRRRCPRPSSRRSSCR